MEECNNKNIPRLINLRKAFVVFLGIIIGILLSYNFFVNTVLNATLWWYYCLIGICVLTLISSLFYVLYFYKHCYIERLRRFCVIALILTISILIGVGVTSINTRIYYDTYKFSGSGKVVANVCDIKEYEYGKAISLDNVSVEVDGGITKLSGKSKLYLSNSVVDEEIKIGFKLSFNATIQANKIIKYDDCQKLINSYGYEISLDKTNSDLEIVENITQFKYLIKSHIRNILIDNMSQTNANLAYGMLFGDKTDLDESVNESFSVTGVMHLLAVSGLHIGIISGAVYSIVGFVTRKLKLAYTAKTIIDIFFIALFLLFYMYICDFSASVVRASIMVIVYLICKTSGLKYDILTSLSIAGIIILLISPLSLFSVGFQLSFLCIFAIITLVPKFLEITNKLHIPKFLSTSLITSIAINIVIMPIMINCFGEASLLSVIANIAVIPLFSIVFPIIFFITMVCAIMPFMGFLLWIPNIGVQILIFVINLFASIPIGMIKSFRVGYLCFGLITVFAFIYKYLMCKFAIKYTLVALLVIFAVVTAVINAIPRSLDGSMLYLREKYDEVDCVYVNNDEVVVFGKPDDVLNDLIYDLKISHINALVLYDFSFKDVAEIKSYCMENEISTIYLDKSFGIYDDFFKSMGLSIKYYDTHINIGSSKINIVKDNKGNLLAFLFVTQNSNVLYLMDSLSNSQYSYLGSELNISFDVIVSMDDDVDLFNYDLKSDKVIFKSGDNNDQSLTNYDYYEINFRKV